MTEHRYRRTSDLTAPQLKHFISQFEKRSHALIGEYLVVYRHLLFRIAILLERNINPTMTATDVEQQIDKRPKEMIQELRRALTRVPINDKNEQFRIDPFVSLLRHLVDLRNLLAHAEFEYGPSWCAEIVDGRPWWEAKSAKLGEMKFTEQTITTALSLMRQLGRPISQAAKHMGLTVPEEIDSRPLTSSEIKRLGKNTRFHMLHRGISITIDPEAQADQILITDGANAYDDLAKPLNDAAKKLGLDLRE